MGDERAAVRRTLGATTLGLPALASVGGMAPSGVVGGGGGAPVYNLTLNGDIYDGARFEDRVIETLRIADSRGRR